MSAPGYSPAPTVATRILGPDGVPLTGDVSLANGNNMGISRVGNVLTLAATSPSALRSVTAFAPGAAVARTLQRAQVTGAIVRSLDIRLLTAAVGVNSSNIANVIVQGTLSGGPIVVPLSAGVSEFHLGVGDLSTALAGERITANPADTGMQGWAHRFRVSAQTTVRNATVQWGTNGPSNFASTSGRIGIATGVVDGTPVQSPNWVTDAGGSPCFVDVDLSGAIPWPVDVLAQFASTTGYVLNTGIDYFLCVVALNNRQADTQRITRPAKGNGSTTTATNQGNIIAQNYTITCAADDTSQRQFGTISNGVHGAGAILTGNEGILSFSLYGAILGAVLTGYVEIGQTITGAPPGTTGSDANILVQC